MPFKVIIHVDKETGAVEHFPWDKKEKPPPLVRGKMKKPETEYSRNSEEDKNKTSKSIN